MYSYIWIQTEVLAPHISMTEHAAVMAALEKCSVTQKSDLRWFIMQDINILQRSATK